MLTNDDVGDGRTVVHQVPGSSASQTPTNCQTELELNSFGNVEPVQVVMKKTFQATVELPSAGDEWRSYAIGLLSATIMLKMSTVGRNARWVVALYMA